MPPLGMKSVFDGLKFIDGRPSGLTVFEVLLYVVCTHGGSYGTVS